MSSNIFDSDRVSKIGEIMPRFQQHVQPGDQIMLGLEGDPAFPYGEDRPVGTVTRTKSLEDGSTSVRVRMNTGQSVTLQPNTVDPKQVWEFTDDSFQKVLARSVQPEPERPEQTYRGTTNEVDSLRQELDMIKAQMHAEAQEVRKFNNTLISTLNEISQDVCKTNSDANFCKVFATEYRSMMENDAAPASESKYFDSDFSDSDGDF